MELHEILNMDCRVKENRLRLTKRIKKSLDIEGALTLETVIKAVNQFENCGYWIQVIAKVPNGYSVSINIPNEGYSVFKVKSMMEAYCKSYLYIKEFIKFKKRLG